MIFRIYMSVNWRFELKKKRKKKIVIWFVIKFYFLMWKVFIIFVCFFVMGGIFLRIICGDNKRIIFIVSFDFGVGK